MKSVFRVLMLVVLLLGLNSLGEAALLYNNGLPDAQSGNEMTMWIQAEDFTLSLSSTVTDVRFWAFGFAEPGSYLGSIVWRIYADNAGQPGGILHSGSTVPTRVFSHNNYFGPSYQHDFSVGSLILGAGTYWLGLHNGPLTTDSRKDYYWETTSANATIRGNEDKSPFDDGSWFNNIQEHAFQLYGTQVPVPGAIFLFGPGLAALALLRKRLTG